MWKSTSIFLSSNFLDRQIELLMGVCGISIILFSIFLLFIQGDYKIMAIPLVVKHENFFILRDLLSSFFCTFFTATPSFPNTCILPGVSGIFALLSD